MRDTIEQIAVGGRAPWGEVRRILLVSIVGLLVLVRVASMIWSGTRLYEFRLSRVGEDMRTEYGLLTRVTATIPLRRVQTLTIREAPLQRLLHRMSVRVETAGGQSTHSKARRNHASGSRRLFEGPMCLPSCARCFRASIWTCSTGVRCIRARSPGRSKPALIIGTVMTLPLFGLFGWRAILVLPFTLAWMTVVAWKQVQRTQWTLTDDAVVFRSGWSRRNVTIARS